MPLPKTLQAWFATAWQWSVVDGHPPSYSKVNDGTAICKYRGADGTRCLIGAGIPDSVYTTNMEGHAAREALDGLVPVALLSDLNALQRCHDHAAPEPNYHKNVKLRLRMFAEMHHLTIPRRKG